MIKIMLKATYDELITCTAERIQQLLDENDHLRSSLEEVTLDRDNVKIEFDSLLYHSADTIVELNTANAALKHHIDDLRSQLSKALLANIELEERVGLLTVEIEGYLNAHDHYGEPTQE